MLSLVSTRLVYFEYWGSLPLFPFLAGSGRFWPLPDLFPREGFTLASITPAYDCWSPTGATLGLAGTAPYPEKGRLEQGISLRGRTVNCRHGVGNPGRNRRTWGNWGSDVGLFRELYPVPRECLGIGLRGRWPPECLDLSLLPVDEPLGPLYEFF